MADDQPMEPVPVGWGRHRSASLANSQQSFTSGNIQRLEGRLSSLLCVDVSRPMPPRCGSAMIVWRRDQKAGHTLGSNFIFSLVPREGTDDAPGTIRMSRSDSMPRRIQSESARRQGSSLPTYTPQFLHSSPQFRHSSPAVSFMHVAYVGFMGFWADLIGTLGSYGVKAEIWSRDMLVQGTKPKHDGDRG